MYTSSIHKPSDYRLHGVHQIVTFRGVQVHLQSRTTVLGVLVGGCVLILVWLLQPLGDVREQGRIGP